MSMFNDINDVADKITYYIRSGVQAIQLVVGGQTNAAEVMLDRIAKQQNMEFTTWDPAKGFGANQHINPVQALETVASSKTVITGDALVAMHDLHYDLNHIPALVSTIKRLISMQAFNNKTHRRPIVLLTTSPGLNPDVLPYLKVIELVLPSREQMTTIFNGVQSSISNEEKRVCSDELKHQIVNALSGLTSSDAADVLAESLLRHGRFCEAVIDTIEEEKGLLLKKSEVLTYTPKSEIMGMDDLGGFSELKSWLDQRAVAYSAEAESLKLAMPKGIVLVGVPGTGKSRCAQIIARKLKQPLIRFDLGAVFNSLVGESERRTRETIRIADAMGGCVLLIDEADKVLGGANESTGDSGVTRRIFGQLLTWLAEKKSKTFVVLTMNRVTGMPPELLRRGRFDEIFFVDTPDEVERKSIFEIHMTKNTVNPSNFSESDWSRIVENSEGFVGAEIEQAVIASRFSAYSADPASGAVFNTEQLVSTLKEIVPVTKMDPENIEQIRTFGRERARNVSGRRSRVVKQQTRSVDLSFRDPNVS